jgi:hypothetical protein
MAEFKIARLRYNWAGEWADSTFYNRDAVVQYNGKTYVCLVAHTSAEDFYDDFYYQTESLADEPRWTTNDRWCCMETSMATKYFLFSRKYCSIRRYCLYLYNSAH